MLWDDMVSLPLFAEPTVLVWSRTIGGVNADAAQHQPAVVRPAVGGADAGVDQQHHAVVAGAVGEAAAGPLGLGRCAGATVAARSGPMPTRYDLRTLLSHCYARRSGGIGRRASLRGWCPQGRGGSSPPSDTIKTRLLESNLLVEDVHRWRSVHFHVEVIR